MKRSLVEAAFLLAVLPFFGCQSNVGESEVQGLANQGSNSESGKADSSNPTHLPDLVKPQKLEAVLDPAFEGWLDAGGIPPDLLAIHPAGRSALVAVGYLSVLYDLESGQELKSWTERFSMARFSGDGSRLVTLGADPRGAPRISVPHRLAVVWDAETGEELSRIVSSRPAWNRSVYGASNNAVALNHDGTQLALSNFRDSFDPRQPHGVLLFDVQSGRLRTALPMPLASQIGMVFVAGGKRLLIRYTIWRPGEAPGRSPQLVLTSALWDTRTGELVHQFPDETTVCVSPDGQWIATGSAVKRNLPEHRPAVGDTTTLTIWDASTGERVQKLEHDSNLRDFTFSPDSEKLLVSVGGRLVEWQWRLGEKVHESDSEKPYARVYYSPDGRRRFALTEELSGVDDDLVYRLRGWTIATGDELSIDGYEMSYNTIEELFFFADGNRFVKFSQSLRAYAERDILSGKIVREPPKCRAATTGCVFMPDGDRLLVRRPHYFTDSLLTDLKSGSQRQWYLPGEGKAFLGDGRLLFVCNFKCLTLIDVVSNEIMWQYLLDESKIAARISPSGRHVVVAAYDTFRQATRRRLVLLDTSKPSEIVVRDRHVTALSFHPKGDRFAEATIDSVSESEPTKGDRIRLLFEVPGRTLDLQYSLSGKQVLACGVVGHEDSREPITIHDEGWVVLWDDGTGETIRLDGHEAPVTCAAFSPDGQRCVTGSLDKMLRLWDTATGRLLHTFQGHLGEIRSVAWSPKGDRILSAAEDGAAFWNVTAFAATPAKPSPLAASFQVVEKVGTTDTVMYVPTRPQGLVLPIPKDYQPPSVPVRKTENWAIIELGEVKPVPAWDDQSSWLSLAESTRRYAGPLPVPEAARFGRQYVLRGTTRDGNRKVYVSWIEKKAILCDEHGEIIRTWDARISAESRVGLLPGSEELAIAHETRLESGDYRYEIVVYDLESGGPKHKFVQDDGRELHGFHVLPTRSMYMLGLDGNWVLYDYQKGRIVDELPALTTGTISPSSFSPDGRFVAVSALANANVTLRDPITLEPRKTLVNPFSVRWFKFSPDGKRLAVGQQSNLITMWDVDSARQLWTRRGAGNWTGTTVLFSLDGSRFLSRASRSLAALWDADAGDVLCVIRGPVDTVMLHPNGESLHLGTIDGPMIWPELEEPLQ